MEPQVRRAAGQTAKASSASASGPQLPSRAANATANFVADEIARPAATTPPQTGAFPSFASEPLSPVSTTSSFNATTSTAAAVAPARESTPVSEAPKEIAKPQIAATGLTVEQVNEIKSSIQSQQKFIGELLEHASRWELEGAELRIYFPSEESAFAGLIEGRETLEKIRTSSSKVLGRSVRVCAKLESGAANGANASRSSSTQEMRAQFENDPMVKSMLQRFGGRISEVRRRTGE